MTGKSYVYLDYAASAPLRPCAMEAWVGYHKRPHSVANPNSLHTLGRTAARELEGAHRTLARCIGCGFRPNEVILTSGGTESNNLAVLGMAEGARRKSANKRTRVVLSAIEHDSVLDVASILRSRGFEVVLARPGRDGVISAEEVASHVDEATALVSVMAANNETASSSPRRPSSRRPTPRARLRTWTPSRPLGASTSTAPTQTPSPWPPTRSEVRSA